MRDLYTRLGVSHTASREEIKRAIEKCANAGIRADAEAVLLNARAKPAYDRLNKLLDDVGTLRASLGLNSAAHWVASDTSDYTKEVAPSRSERVNAAKQRANDRANRKSEKGKSASGRFFSIVARYRFPLLLIGAVAWALFEGDWEQPQHKTVAPQEPSFAEPVAPFPATGTVRYPAGAKGVAPLKIKTSPGSDYYVKLVEPPSDKPAMEVFVQGGSTVEVSAPLGSYEMRYATGQTWYGPEHFFGPETSYTKADQLFVFSQDYRGTSGYTVTLYTVHNGNLSTETLSRGQF
jgi:hypothetical protein